MQSVKEDNNKLLEAAKSGNIDDVENLLNEEGKAQVNATDEKGRTPLHWAIILGNKKVVETLLKVNGINVNATDWLQKTPLHVAATHNHKEVVEALLDKGANVNAVDKDGKTPLNLAHGDIRTLLIDTALLEAAKSGDINEVKHLISEGADVNAVKGLHTSLYWAAKNGHVSIIEVLLDNGADVAHVNYSMERDVLTLLQEKEAEYCKSSLHLAARLGNLKEVENLLREGADVNVKNDKGEIPLHFAAEMGHAEIVKDLLDKGANVNAEDKYDSTPLHRAAGRDHAEIVKDLLGKGANVNAVDGNEKTPLHRAAENGHKEVVEALLDKGANVNAVDKDGKTPFNLTTNEDIKALLQPAKKSDDGLGGKSPESNEGNPGEDTGTQQKEKQEGNAKEETQTSTNSTVNITEEGKHYNESEYFSGSQILNYDYQDKLTNILINSHCSLNGGERTNLANNIHQIRQIFSQYTDNNINSVWIGVFDIGKLDTDEFKERKAKSGKEEYLKNSIHVRFGDVQDKVLVYSWLDTNQFSQDKWDNLLLQLEKDHKVDFIGTGPLTFKYKDFNYHVYPPLFGSSDGEQSSLSNTEVFSFSRTEVNQIIENIKRSHQSIKKQVIDHYASLNKDFVENDVDFVKIITNVNNKTKLTSIRYSNTSKDITLESEIKYETTPLHTLAKLGDELLSNVNDLLAGGADVNAMDKSEKTPLHYAAKNGHVKIVQVLLKADGINVNAVDEDGKTPFDLTTNEEIKALLQNAEKTDPVDESSTDSEGGQGEDAGASGEPSTPTRNHGGRTSNTSAEKGTDIKAEGVEAIAPIEPAQTEEQPSSFFGSLFSILMKPFSLIGSFFSDFFSWLFGSDEPTQSSSESDQPVVLESPSSSEGNDII